MDEALPMFKAAGLTQEQAQAFVDFYGKHAIETANQATQTVERMRADWQTQAKALPDIGGKLGSGGEVNVAVSRMLDSMGNAKLASDFRAAMDLTGAGDHPAFIQVMYWAAQQLAEAGPVKGNSPSPFGQQKPGSAARPSHAQALWPTLPSGG